ncbi:MAG: HEAT repeat domain-containing protein [Gemmatimonadota bacterium]|nr:HEAT repeat domain-containing protein [Gemmatimonadota bacterium]
MKHDRPLCERFLREAWLIETGEARPEVRAWWEAHRDSCSECRAALAEARAALDAYDEAAAVELSDEDFERMVRRARQRMDRSPEERPARRQPAGGFARALLGMAAAVVLVGLGWALGRSTSPDGGPGEAEALRAELREARAEIALASMDDPSASERIHGVLLASRVERPEATLLSAVVGVLERDPSPNVRLAAVDALHAFEDLEPVRRRLLTALTGDPSPAIRIALIDLLVDRRLEGGEDALDRLERDAEEPAVRERAAWARRALS